MSSLVTHSELKRLLRYEPETGQFHRLQSADKRNSKHVGKVAGCVAPQGYVYIKIRARNYTAARLALFYVNGRWPSGEVDHINRIKSDNRLCNLRAVSRSENFQNRVDPMPKNTTGLLGVTRSQTSSRFFAMIHVPIRKRIYLGSFATAEEAHAAYMEAKKKYHLHAPSR